MSTNLTNESTAESSPRRKGRIRRVLKRVFYLIVILIGVFAVYAWATGARQEPIETGEPHMKAVVYTNYGSPDVLEIRDIKKPVPNDDQVLIKVRAASINPLDWHFMEGTPYIMRMGVGLRKPKDPRLGVDVAGQVEAVGKNVTQFKPGDEVFGGRNGAFAEYVCARADRAIVLKPANLTFEQAASVPIAAITALQGLRDKGKIQPGQKVLINGASGGVGTFAVHAARETWTWSVHSAQITSLITPRKISPRVSSATT
jgi:D-arabinose 1-dehydrogenase-like Zn-dependent alcohol dehydrogenase